PNPPEDAFHLIARNHAALLTDFRWSNRYARPASVVSPANSTFSGGGTAVASAGMGICSLAWGILRARPPVCSRQFAVRSLVRSRQVGSLVGSLGVRGRPQWNCQLLRTTDCQPELRTPRLPTRTADSATANQTANCELRTANWPFSRVR